MVDLQYNVDKATLKLHLKESVCQSLDRVSSPVDGDKLILMKTLKMEVEVDSICQPNRSHIQNV